MADPLTDLIEFLADDLGVLARDVRRALERAEARGKATIRLIDEPIMAANDDLAQIEAEGRGRCLCPLSAIEAVLIEGKPCGRGGCPYGGER